MFSLLGIIFFLDFVSFGINVGVSFMVGWVGFWNAFSSLCFGLGSLRMMFEELR